MTDKHADIRAAVKHATPGPWQWWTSNSWKRLKHDGKGETQNVIEPYVAHDGHPDLCVSLSDMAYIAACHPEAIRALLAERDALIHDNAEYAGAANALATENERLRDACERAIEWLEGWASAEPYLAELRAALKQQEQGK